MLVNTSDILKWISKNNLFHLKKIFEQHLFSEAEDKKFLFCAIENNRFEIVKWFVSERNISLSPDFQIFCIQKNGVNNDGGFKYFLVRNPALTCSMTANKLLTESYVKVKISHTNCAHSIGCDSCQVIWYENNTRKIAKHIGSAKNNDELEILRSSAKHYITENEPQLSLFHEPISHVVVFDHIEVTNVSHQFARTVGSVDQALEQLSSKVTENNFNTLVCQYEFSGSIKSKEKDK